MAEGTSLVNPSVYPRSMAQLGTTIPATARKIPFLVQY
jgi:hypothetical protein